MLAVPSAHAEGDRALTAELGWATFSAPGAKKGSMAPPTLSPDIGGSLAVIYEHAIGTDLALRGELAGALFEGGAQAKQSATSGAELADVAALFRFDVLKYVPYAFGGLGELCSAGGPIARSCSAVIAIGGGLDVLTNRTRSWGIEGRIASFGGNVTMFTLGVRGSIRWGYF